MEEVIVPVEQQQQQQNSNTILALKPKQEKRNTKPNAKTTRGRQKIEIKQIGEENRRQVTFSKRRGGLFKKSAELSVLSGAQIAVITFSQCGRIYTFCSSDLETLMEKYLQGKPVRLERFSGDSNADVAVMEDGWQWWERPVERVPEEELEEYLSAMRGLRENLVKSIQQVDYRTVENAGYWKSGVKNLTVENQTPVNPTAQNDLEDDRNGDANFDGEGFVDDFLAQSGY